MAEKSEEGMVTDHPQAVDVAQEAKEPSAVPDIVELCKTTFDKTADFFNGELLTTAEDYRVLEQMNVATTEKYREMKTISVNIHQAMRKLNDKYQTLLPYLERIDQIEQSVAGLEEAAYRLDAYSKKLEAKFKQLERK